MRGFSAEDTEAFEVSPIVEKVLPPDRIAEIAERIRAYTGAGPAAPDGEPLDAPEDGEEAG